MNSTQHTIHYAFVRVVLHAFTSSLQITRNDCSRRIYLASWLEPTSDISKMSKARREKKNGKVVHKWKRNGQWSLWARSCVLLFAFFHIRSLFPFLGFSVVVEKTVCRQRILTHFPLMMILWMSFALDCEHTRAQFIGRCMIWMHDWCYCYTLHISILSFKKL